MKRTLIQADLEKIPPEFHNLMYNAEIYDSSSSEEARVYFIQKDQGYFLKTAALGTLQHEAEMTQYFHRKNLAAEVLSYLQCDQDWLLTAQIHGDDCVHPRYLEQPKRLCDTLAELLYQLHQENIEGCPNPDYTARYLSLAEENHKRGFFNPKRGLDSPQKAWDIVKNSRHLLHTDTLIHGDYCLPNIILNNWNFSGFIDVDHSGVGDRHVDIYWALWSLNYNLKTDQYIQRFIDGYGKKLVDIETLKLIAAIECFG